MLNLLWNSKLFNRSCSLLLPYTPKQNKQSGSKIFRFRSETEQNQSPQTFLVYHKTVDGPACGVLTLSQEFRPHDAADGAAMPQAQDPLLPGIHFNRMLNSPTNLIWNHFFIVQSTFWSDFQAYVQGLRFFMKRMAPTPAVLPQIPTAGA